MDSPMVRYKGMFVTMVLVSAFSLSGCSTNSNGGTTLGQKGSNLWHRNAPAIDVANYYAPKQVYELCNTWDAKWRNTFVRNAISKALIKKGEDPMYCSNPAEDAVRKSDAQTRRMKERIDELEREMEKRLEDLE
jgi:hypothetical protein